jgi:HSP20 family protein
MDLYTVPLMTALLEDAEMPQPTQRKYPQSKRTSKAKKQQQEQPCCADPEACTSCGSVPVNFHDEQPAQSQKGKEHMEESQPMEVEKDSAPEKKEVQEKPQEPKKKLARLEIERVTIDVQDKEQALVVRATLPQGMPVEKLDLTLQNGVLSLRGEHEVKNETMRYVERFERHFPVARDTDESKITATFKDRVLEVTVPKPESVRPHRIAINLANAEAPKALPQTMDLESSAPPRADAPHQETTPEPVPSEQPASASA